MFTLNFAAGDSPMPQIFSLEITLRVGSDAIFGFFQTRFAS